MMSIRPTYRTNPSYLTTIREARWKGESIRGHATQAAAVASNDAMPSQTIPHLTTSPYPWDQVQGATEQTRTIRRWRFGQIGGTSYIDGFGYPTVD